MAGEVKAAGSIAAATDLFDSLAENGIAGGEISNGKAVFTSKAGYRVEVPLRSVKV